MSGLRWMAIGALALVVLVLVQLWQSASVVGSTSVPASGVPRQSDAETPTEIAQPPEDESGTGARASASARAATPHEFVRAAHSIAAEAELRVHVWNSSRARPLASARVTLRTLQTLADFAHGETDGRGAFVCRVPCSRKLVVHVDPPLGAKFTISQGDTVTELAAGAEGEVHIDVQLDELYTFYGRVVDLEDMQAVVGLPIMERMHSTPSVDASTDSAGRFQIPIASTTAGFPTVVLGPPAYGAVRLRLDRQHATPDDELVIVLRRAARVHGIVLGEDGSPWRGDVQVSSLEEASMSEPMALSATAQAADDGHFAFECLPAHTPLVVHLPQYDRFEAVELVLAAGEDREIVLHSRGLAEIAGHVLDAEGRAVSDAKVELIDPREGSWRRAGDRVVASAETQADGAYTLVEVPLGSWGLRASKTIEAHVFSVRTHVDVVDAHRNSGIDLRLAELQSIHGHFFDDRGAPVEDGLVELHALDGGGAQSTTCDADGAFAFDELASGTYVLQGRKWQGGSSALVQAHSGDALVTLRITDRGSLRGQVFDASGRPANGAAILLVSANRSDQRASSESDGRFVVSGLADGEWLVRAESPGFASMATRQRVGGADVVECTLNLEPAGWLRLLGDARTVRGSYEVRRSGAVVAWGALSAGHDETIAVPAGDLHVVTLTGANAGEGVSVNVGVGETKLVRLALPR